MRARPSCGRRDWVMLEPASETSVHRPMVSSNEWVLVRPSRDPGLTSDSNSLRAECVTDSG